MSVHSDISNDMRARIEKGEYKPGEMIDSLRKLAVQYKTSPEVIRLALDILRRDGLIFSRHGKGNFVAQNPVAFREVLVITPLDGHLNQDIVAEFIRRFSEHPECRLLMEDIQLSDNIVDFEAIERRSNELRRIIDDRLLNGKLDAIFFDGASRVRLSFLSEYINKVKLFCFFDISQLVEVPCPSVSIDFYHGYYIGMHHLFDCGCKNILAVNLPENDKIYSFHDELFKNTAITECEEAGVNLKMCRSSDDIIEILKENPEIDGVFAHADVCFCDAMKRFKEIGKTPGKDIALVGFYNTPWCEMFNTTLTSIEIFPKKIVDVAVEMYFTEQPYKAFVNKIRPKLIIRESTAELFKK